MYNYSERKENHVTHYTAINQIIEREMDKTSEIRKFSSFVSEVKRNIKRAVRTEVNFRALEFIFTGNSGVSIRPFKSFFRKLRLSVT